MRLTTANTISSTLVFQSTHPYRMRPSKNTSRIKTRSFNPRTRIGCDLANYAVMMLVYSFNPRTRIGCDSKCFSTQFFTFGFNPRTRIGCDLLLSTQIIFIAWFQSTHPYRMRHVNTPEKNAVFPVSIHAPV